MSRKVRLILEGNYTDITIVSEFKNLLIKYGSDTILMTDILDEADMKVDITELSDKTDLARQVNYTIQSAKEIQKVIKKRKRIIKQALGTSRKDIN